MFISARKKEQFKILSGQKRNNGRTEKRSCLWVVIPPHQKVMYPSSSLHVGEKHKGTVPQPQNHLCTHRSSPTDSQWPIDHPPAMTLPHKESPLSSHQRVKSLTNHSISNDTCKLMTEFYPEEFDYHFHIKSSWSCKKVIMENRYSFLLTQVWFMYHICTTDQEHRTASSA